MIEGNEVITLGVRRMAMFMTRNHKHRRLYYSHDHFPRGSLANRTQRRDHIYF